MGSLLNSKRLAWAATLVLAVGAVVWSSLQANRYVQAVAWVDRSFEISRTLEGILSNLGAAESAQRGYVLTGEGVFLAPYASARSALADLMTWLGDRTSADPRQKRRVDVLENLIAQRMNRLEVGITLRGAGHAEEAIAAVRRSGGRAIMDRIRHLIGAMEREEEDLLRRRSTAAQRAQWRAAVALGGVAAAVILLITFSLVSTERDLRALHASRRRAEQSEAQARALAEELRALSLQDELTGLHNRRGFTLIGEQMLRLAARESRSACLLFLDVDRMKDVNDRFGHEAGDRALVATAEVLRRTLRSSDLGARLGGDEFAGLAMDVDPTEAPVLIERARTELRVLNGAGGLSVTLSLSIGTAFFDPNGSRSLEAMLSEADEQMYAEKRRHAPEGRSVGDVEA